MTRFRIHYTQNNDDYTIDIDADNSEEAQKAARKQLGVIIIRKTKRLKEN